MGQALSAVLKTVWGASGVPAHFPEPFTSANTNPICTVPLQVLHGLCGGKNHFKSALCKEFFVRAAGF